MILISFVFPARCASYGVGRVEALYIEEQKLLLTWVFAEQ